jgi:acetoin:2,6-dichlorophenolindophenol oxidoreductase subunit beta
MSAEVIDPVSLAPLDMETISASVQKTGRILIVDTGWTVCGASSEIIARLCEQNDGTNLFNAKRSGFAFTPCPTTKPLENIYYANAKSIAMDAYTMIKNGSGDWHPNAPEAQEISEFKGPF